MMLFAIERFALAGAYTGTGVLFALLAGFGVLSKGASQTFLAMIWIGFVLAISCTETWLKFRAPFAPHHYALDVGRTVFAGLNAVEVALCFSLWLVNVAVSDTDDIGNHTALLIILTFILVIQVLFLYPKVNLRAEHALMLELRDVPDDSLSFHQKMVRTEIEHEVEMSGKPSSVYYFVYAILELMKLSLLFAFVVHFLSYMP